MAFHSESIFVLFLTVLFVSLVVGQSPGGVAGVDDDLVWDVDGDPDDPADYEQDDLSQWKSTCGDDPNEYLIKEHTGSGSEDSVGDDDYACADRVSDCFYDGMVFSRGETYDLSSSSEKGSSVNDFEVCMNLDSSKPGGAFYDMDDDRLARDRLSSGQWSDMSDPDRRIDEYWGSNPGTDRGRAPTGYATEDDCDSDVGGCSDDGFGTSSSSWFNAGEFVEGDQQDNFDSYGGVHNRIQDQSDQFESGAATESNWDRIYSSGFSPSNSQDSTPGPDMWGLSDTLRDSIGNDGNVYSRGRCYGGGRGVSDGSIDKTDRVFGNSYAGVQGGDGTWRDPDDLSSSKLSFSCDLTGPDKGIGFDTNSGNVNSWSYQGSNEVVGDIAWAYGSGKNNGWVQEKNVCGDDSKEYLIEELGSAANPSSDSGAWACSYATDTCVLRNADPGTAIYKENDYVNAGEPGEDAGRLKQDAEVCDTRSGDPHGAWYDQDYAQDYCRENTLYGESGVRWFSESSIEEHPQAVTGGIDDDANDYLKNKVSTLDSNPSKSNWDSSDFNSESPIPAGEPSNNSNPQVASLGFCGGDDESEYLVTQQCNTDLCSTDNSIVGVAEDPDNCVLDHEEVEGASGDKRDLYSEGDEVDLTRGGSTQTIACYGGRWQESWPVSFLKDEVNVALGTTGRIGFQVVNVQDSSRSFDLELEDGSDGTDLDVFTTFAESDTDSMTVSVPAGATRTYDLAVNANSIVEPAKSLTITAEGSDGVLTGQDSTDLRILDSSTIEALNATSQTRDVPGIGFTQVAWLAVVATFTYFLFISRRM